MSLFNTIKAWFCGTPTTSVEAKPTNNNYEPWTEVDEHTLMSMTIADKSDTDIALALSRSVGAIKQKRRKLLLEHYHGRH